MTCGRGLVGAVVVLLGACAPAVSDQVDDDTDIDDTDVDDTNDDDTDDVEPEDTDLETDSPDTDVPGCVFAVTTGAPGDALVIDTSACWEITVDATTLTFRAPSRTNKVENWGELHENLNGKHIKDWEGDRRTLLLDAVVITMQSEDASTVIDTVTIYDGEHLRVIDTATNTITETVDDAEITPAREAAHADGEAASAEEDPATGIVIYANVHDQAEDEEGNALDKVPVTEQLGETGGTAKPNNVRDYYDDPRLGHT